MRAHRTAVALSLLNSDDQSGPSPADLDLERADNLDGLGERLLDRLQALLGMSEDQMDWHLDEEATHATLSITHPSGDPKRNLEFCVTLGAGSRRKRQLRAFVRDARRASERATRVWLEVHTDLSHSWHRVVDRVAHSIREIVQRFRHFGDERLIGVRVFMSRRKPRFQRFNLFESAG